MTPTEDESTPTRATAPADAPISDRRFLGVVGLVFAFAVTLSFGGFLQAPHPTSDDNIWHTALKRSSLESRTLITTDTPEIPLSRRLRECFTNLLSEAHYQPITRCIWTIEYAIAGDDHWMSTVLCVAMALHALTALMLVALLMGLGLPRSLAFVAGLTTLLHPVADVALSNVNATINVYALFFAMLTLVLWRRTVPGSSWRPLSLFGATVAFFLSLNANPPFLASAPLLLGVVTLVAWWQNRAPWRRWLKQLGLRVIPILVAFGCTLWLRHFLYGTITTKIDRAKSFREGASFFTGMWNHFFRLSEPTDGRRARYLGIDLPESHGVELTAWLLVGVAALVGACAACHAFRSGAGKRLDLSRKQLAINLAMVVGLIGSTSLVYYVTTGAIWLHRYQYVGLPGFGLLYALGTYLLVWTVWNTAGRKCGTLACFIVVAGVLAYFGRENAKSVASAVYGHKACRVAADGAAEVWWEHPEIERIFILDLPAAVNRSGLMFLRDTALTDGVELAFWLKYDLFRLGARPDKNGRGVMHEAALLKQWSALATDPEARRATAILRFDRDAIRLERVSQVTNLNSHEHPGPFHFGPDWGGESLVREKESRFEVRYERDITFAYETARPRGAVKKFRRLIRSSPDKALASLDQVVKASGRTIEPDLMALTRWNRQDIRTEAASRLEDIWGLDDPAELVRRLGSRHEGTARAAARILGMRESDPTPELAMSALNRDITAIEYLAERSRRGDRGAIEPLKGLLGKESEELRFRAAACLARFDDAVETARARAAVLDDRIDLDLRLGVLRTLMSIPGACDPASIGLLSSLESSRSQFWSRIPELVPSTPAIAGRRLLIESLSSKVLSPALIRTSAAIWRSVLGSEVHPGKVARAASKLRAQLASGALNDPSNSERQRVRSLEAIAKADPQALPGYWSVLLQVEILNGANPEELAKVLARAPEEVRRRMRLDQQTPAFGASAPAIAMELEILPGTRSPVRPNSTLGVMVRLTNPSTQFIPGGPGPLTPKLWIAAATKRKGADTDQSGLVSHDLPPAGLAPGESVTMALPVRVPGEHGRAVIGARILRRAKSGSDESGASNLAAKLVSITISRK